MMPVSFSPFGPLCRSTPEVWLSPSIMVGMTPQSLTSVTVVGCAGQGS